MFNFGNLISEGSRDHFLLSQIDASRLPKHVAVIMDGNGRWAARRRKPRVAGHRAGATAVRDTVETAARLGISYLTLYAFSVENWKRPRSEVSTLMALLKEFLRKELNTLKKNNIRFQTIGRINELESEVQKELLRAIEATRDCTGMALIVALNYGGRAEIVDACRKLCTDIVREKRDPSTIDEATFAHYLYTAGIPDPDLLIRTSGEMRISNFLLWEIAYSEIVVVETLWPDFRRCNFFEAIIEYQKRERRFGGLSPKRSQKLATVT